ncbi:ATP-binding protein [Flavobacterium sp. K5-23]|uniref:sensor histidine kinase n=1 Tax=Flavobacterium sp. K5-23 TaxID=2746225 RepID=UPI00200D0906|nr:HAMP domain-containing sensor histidine kinase [Flavobacterium sp. K5-23]UQD56512.1 HAMP domain-containing histidine kinase [Flavobacterium sp. K5-23]
MEEPDTKCQAKLESLKKEFEDFIYIISHDMKTPMRAISNISNWIEEDLGATINPSIKENFNLLKNRVQRLENMMNAMLELSRVERYDMDFIEVNIPKLIDEIIFITKDKLNTEFHISLHLKNENFITYIKKLEKVLLSVIDNSVRFNNNIKKNVYIEVVETDINYEFEIKDDGLGVEEAVKDKIFDIFYTVHSKDVLDTTGSGLAISDKILKFVGGNIEYKKNPSGGSIFKMIWPKNIEIKK